MLFIGDIHGDFYRLFSIIENNRYNILIQVGDFGLGFNKRETEELFLEELNQHLIENKTLLYVIRGNHDNPIYWKNHKKYSHLYLVEDYSTYIIENKKVLFIGGGTSIDRVDRKVNKTWWVDEKIEFKNEIETCDILVTHVPLKEKMINFNFQKSKLVDIFANKEARILNSNLYDDLDKEQLRLKYIYEKSRPKIWISGHMHVSERNITEETAKNVVNQAFEKFDLRKTIEQLIFDKNWDHINLKSAIRNEVAKCISEKIEIKIKEVENV